MLSMQNKGDACRTSSLGRQHEQRVLAVGRIEDGEEFLAVVVTGGTIEAEVLPGWNRKTLM